MSGYHTLACGCNTVGYRCREHRTNRDGSNREAVECWKCGKFVLAEDWVKSGLRDAGGRARTATGKSSEVEQYHRTARRP